MGIYYSVACRDCKVTRDLDKHYINHDGVETYEDAIKYADYFEGGLKFGTVLLLAFLVDHIGHSIVYYNEFHDDIEKEAFNYKDESHFWHGGSK